MEKYIKVNSKTVSQKEKKTKIGKKNQFCL